MSISDAPGTDLEVDHHALDHDPHQRDGNQHLPAEAHDLVVAVAREGGAQPQEQEQEEEDLQEQPVEAVTDEQPIQPSTGTLRTAGMSAAR